MHPEYPSQAAILGAVSNGVFDAVLGAGTTPRIVVTDTADPKVTRQFDNFAAIVEETRIVRIWGGIHFRNSLEVSDVMGARSRPIWSPTRFVPFAERHVCLIHREVRRHRISCRFTPARLP